MTDIESLSAALIESPEDESIRQALADAYDARGSPICSAILRSQPGKLVASLDKFVWELDCSEFPMWTPRIEIANPNNVKRSCNICGYPPSLWFEGSSILEFAKGSWAHADCRGHEDYWRLRRLADRSLSIRGQQVLIQIGENQHVVANDLVSVGADGRLVRCELGNEPIGVVLKTEGDRATVQMNGFF